MRKSNSMGTRANRKNRKFNIIKCFKVEFTITKIPKYKSPRTHLTNFVPPCGDVFYMTEAIN